MVLTRAQAPAQAAAQAAAQADVQVAPHAHAQAAAAGLRTEIGAGGHGAGQGFSHAKDTAIVPHNAFAQTPVFELNPTATEHVMNLAQYFIAKTQALAENQALFQYRQRGEADAQNAALMAVQASTESSVQQLTEQQRAIAQQLSEAQAATHSELENHFQRMQVLEGERILQIEKFVNAKLGEALQEAQKSRQEIASQTDSARLLLDELEHAVANNQASVATHIRQVVDEKLAIVQQGSHGLDATHVRRVVEDTVAAALAESKTAFDAELQRVRSDIQREVTATLDEPVRRLVIELTAQAARQLESRLQNVVTTTQSDLNLQMQRQADATSVLRDKLRKQQARSKHQLEHVDPTRLKTSIKEVLRSNPDLVGGTERTEQQHPSDDAGHEAFDQINATIERSVGAAATTIGNAISGCVRSLTRRSRRSSYCFDDSDSDDDVWMSAEARQRETRMQDAWRIAYLCGKSGHTALGSDAANDHENSRCDQVEEEPKASSRRDMAREELDLSSQIKLQSEGVAGTGRDVSGGAGIHSSVYFVVPPAHSTHILVQQSARYERSANAILRADTEVLPPVPPLAPRYNQCQDNELLQLRASRQVHFQDNERHHSPAPLPIQYQERRCKTQSPSPQRCQPREHYRQVERQLKPARSTEMQRLVKRLQREVAGRAELVARRHLAKKGRRP